MHDALHMALDAAYAVRGVEGVFTPKAGTGPFAVTAIVRPVALQDEVARLLASVGDRMPGYRVRLRVAEVLVRPRDGDVIAIADEELTLRVKGVQTSELGAEWLVAAVPVATVVVATHPVGHLQPPLLGGWAWA